MKQEIGSFRPLVSKPFHVRLAASYFAWRRAGFSPWRALRAAWTIVRS